MINDISELKRLFALEKKERFDIDFNWLYFALNLC